MLKNLAMPNEVQQVGYCMEMKWERSIFFLFLGLLGKSKTLAFLRMVRYTLLEFIVV